MNYQRIFLQIGLLLVIVGAGGCFSANPSDIEAFTKPKDVVVTEDRYILQPPDEIEIYCSKVPELHLQRQQIRPDGKVAFEALGEVYAAGKTPKELSEIMYKKIVLLYTLTGDHPIDVRIVAYKSKFYYVLGQVFFPGPKTTTGRDTALKAIAKARLTNLAWQQKIQIIRPSRTENGEAKVFELDFNQMSLHGDMSKNVLLEEGDIIFVPPTVLATIGLTVEQLVSPIGRAFSTVNIVEGPDGR